MPDYFPGIDADRPSGPCSRIRVRPMNLPHGHLSRTDSLPGRGTVANTQQGARLAQSPHALARPSTLQAYLTRADAPRCFVLGKPGDEAVHHPMPTSP